MKEATSSTEGYVVLSGDLVGGTDAGNPQLRLSGITSGATELVKKAYVDDKGRLNFVSTTPQSEIDALVDAAYAAHPGDFTIVGGRPVRNVPTATASDPGAVRLGGGVATTPGTLGLRIATPSATGIVEPGTGFLLSGDTVSLDPDERIPANGGVITNGSLQNTAATGMALGSNNQIQVWPTQLTRLLPDAISEEPAGLGSNFSAVASNGTILVKVFTTSNQMFSSISTTGRTWDTYRVNPQPPLGTVRGLAYGGGRFVLYGVNSGGGGPAHYTAWSTDGINWTFNTTPWATGTNYLSSLVYVNGKFVTAGVNGTTLYAVSSSNGATWTQTATAFTIGSQAPQFVATSGNTVVAAVAAVSLTARAIYTSTDGVSWTNRSSAFPLTTFSTSSVSGLIAGGSPGHYLMPGGSTTSAHNIYYTTNDCVSWSVVSNPAGSTTISSIFWTGSNYIAYTGNGRTLTGSTISSWSQTSTSRPAKGTLTYAMFDRELTSGTATGLGVGSLASMSFTITVNATTYTKLGSELATFGDVVTIAGGFVSGKMYAFDIAPSTPAVSIGGTAWESMDGFKYIYNETSQVWSGMSDLIKPIVHNGVAVCPSILHSFYGTTATGLHGSIGFVTADGGSTWNNSAPTQVYVDLLLPDRAGTGGGSTSRADVILETIIEFTNKDTPVMFSNTTAPAKVPGGRMVLWRNQPNTLTCISTAANEWLVLKD